MVTSTRRQLASSSRTSNKRKLQRRRQSTMVTSSVTAALLVTAVTSSISGDAAATSSVNNSSIRQSERNLHRPISPQLHQQQVRPFQKGQHQQHQQQQHKQQQKGHHQRALQNNQKGKKKGSGGAFNPNLVAYDPNSSEYMHGNPASGSFTNAKVTSAGTSSSSSSTSGSNGSSNTEGKSSSLSTSWSPCPTDDPSFKGDRASYDCLSYIYCSEGQMRGSYQSCMGLMFDNVRGVCDWKESVVCEGVSSVSNSDSGGGGDGGGGGGEPVKKKEMGSATAIAVATSETAGSNGATANNEVTGWGGSDWGGKWINGQWVPDGQHPSSPATSPGNSDSSTAWLDIQWDKSTIVPYPPYSILPSHNHPNSATLSTTDDAASLPAEYTSPEGWSSLSRSKAENGTPKTVVGYFAAWQWYDNAERASPKNMQFNKLDRVNFAFFQTNEEGEIWGTDSWADPITLFGPHDWSIPVPQHAGFAPQFFDDNGFDDSSGSEYNYVGSQYIDLGYGIYCHRATPTGKRDCNGHSLSEGLIGRAHEQGALVYPSIGGWSLSDVFPVLSADKEARRNFAKNCVGLIREYNFDGIDIDWEFPGYEPHSGTPADKANFVLLLQDIRAALDAYTEATYPNGERTFGLTAALPCGPPIIDHQDVPAVSAVLSELNLMTYDFHGTWDDMVGVNAPLHDQPEDKFFSPEYSVHGCVERWVREGADPAKINLGLPFYGRSYGGSTKLYEPFDGPDGMNWWADGGQPQYYNILDKLPDMISLRDDVTSTQYAYFEGGGIVSFDDNQAICDKVEYARANDLHGFLIWELSGDLTEDLRTPLLDVVNYKLDQGDEFDCELFRLETRDANGHVIGMDENAEPNPWYANWETGTCINDGRQPAWSNAEEDLFRFKEECCGYKFEYKFNTCVGPPTKNPTARPTREPTPSPIVTDAPTDEPSHVFGAAQVNPSSSVTRSTAAATLNGEPPETWCLGGCKNGNEKCVGNQNHPQNIADDDCKPCQGGQTYWPCDVDGLCFCWDPDTPRIPPAPGSGLAQLSYERPCEYFTKAIFDSLAPDAQHPYTYDGLCEAIDNYNEGHAEKIFMMGTEHERKSELASFLGHTLHESDEWKASREYLMCADNKVEGSETYCKPCDSGSFNWETFKCDGVGLAGGGLTFNGYCDSTISPPQACSCDDTITSEPAPLEGYIPASKVFFGRGAIQLSWNYNFRSASEALTGDSSTFCDNPDLVATTPSYAWGAGIFFWMENLKEETTCHIEALKNADFGGTLNNINGGLECPAYHGGWHGEAIKLRLNRYCKATHALGLDSILIFDGCKGLNTSFVECLGDGTCPDCVQYSDGTAAVAFDANHHIPADHHIPAVESKPAPAEPAITAAPDPTPGPTPNPTPGPTPNPTPQPVDASPSCPADMKSVDGLPDCCVPEPAYHGDGACDPDSPYNTAECAYDGGDCCQETCNVESHYGCSKESFGYGPFGYFCINPDLDEYIDPALCTVSDRTRIGDGRCDAEHNTEACNWDGGDCCSETCDERYAHYDCGDPAYPYDCQNPEFIIVTPNPTPAPSPQPTPAPSPHPSPQPVEVNSASLSSSFADSIASSLASSSSFADSVASSFEPSESSIKTVIASEDATIMKGDADSNYGFDPSLKVKGVSSGPNAHDAIIRFNIPSSGFGASTSVNAILKIYSLSNSDHGGIFHIAPETSPWSEAFVTWNTAPDWDARIGTMGPVGANRWATIDVSDAVSALKGNGGAITIRIRARTPEMIEYSSKEGLHPPEIIIEYGPAASMGNVMETQSESNPSIPIQTPQPTPMPSPKPTSIPTPKPTPSPTNKPITPGLYVLIPSDDATIVADHEDKNFGSDTSLKVDDDSGVYDSLIRFDISGIGTGAVESATLRLFCTDGSDAGGIFGKTSANWDESSVTWSNAPSAYGAPIHSLGSVQTGKWYEVDVTNLFAVGGTLSNAVSIRITSNSWNRAGYSSKEGPESPQLVIKMEDEGYNNIQAESKPSGTVCTSDIRDCPGGSYVKRDPQNGCNFSPCPNQAGYSSSSNGLYFPVWGTGGSIGCVSGNAPSWARGAYLKESKSDCCKAFFKLQVDECLST